MKSPLRRFRGFGHHHTKEERRGHHQPPPAKLDELVCAAQVRRIFHPSSSSFPSAGRVNEQHCSCYRSGLARKKLSTV
jgi:hypothetical protein